MTIRRVVRAAAPLVFGAALHAPAPAGATDLATVLGEVAAANPALEGSRAMADAARLRVSAAGAWASPTLEIGLLNVPATGGLDRDLMTMRTVGLRQRVPLNGANGAMRRAAAFAATGALEAARLERQARLGEAIGAYASAWAAGERVRASEQHIAVMRRSVEAAEARYASGAGRLDEPLAARAEEARARAELATLRAEERAARVALDRLRGRAPEFEADTLEAPSLAPVPDSPAAWMEAVDDRQPRLAAGDAERDRWRAEAGARRRMIWPELEVTGEWGFRSSLDMGDGMRTPLDDMWSVRAGLMLPVFARGRERAEARAMDAMGRSADRARRAAALDLLAGIALAHASARSADQLVRLERDTVLVAGRAALDAAWAAYASGATDLARVLDSAHALYRDELELSRALEARHVAQGRMVALTGRGDLAGVALPREEDQP